MRKFKSNLTRLHDLRKAMTSRCEASLAESIHALTESRTQQKSWEQAVALAAEDAAKQVKQKDTPLLDCLTQRAWFQHLTNSLLQAGQYCQEKEIEVDLRRNELNRAMMDQKVIKNLSSRERKEWLQKVRQEEQKEMDEIAIQNSFRKSSQTDQTLRPNLNE
jgi:flagellar export protein FliJ